MSDYLYWDGREQIFEYLFEGDAGDGEEGGAVGISREGSLTEALVRAAEHARNTQNIAEGTTLAVANIEVTIGPNPPISQYKVTLTAGGG